MVESKTERSYLLPEDIKLENYVNKNPKATGFFSDINETQYDTLKKWKIQLSEENLVTDFVKYHDLMLLRFMRARKFDIKKVHEMFTAYMKWRKDFGVDDIESYDYSEQQKVKEVYPHSYHKNDKYGRPIYIEIISQCNIDEVLTRSNEERMMKYYCKEYERTLKYRFDCSGIKAGKIIEQSCTVICAKDLGISMMTGKVKRFMKLASDIGQNYYPEMLGNMYVINAGFFFSACWAIAKAFIDEKTAKKINIIGSDYLTELKKHIDMNEFPKVLGGNCECKEIEGGCMNSDIGPWNLKGSRTQVYSRDLFDLIK